MDCQRELRIIHKSKNPTTEAKKNLWIKRKKVLADFWFPVPIRHTEHQPTTQPCQGLPTGAHLAPRLLHTLGVARHLYGGRLYTPGAARPPSYVRCMEAPGKRGHHPTPRCSKARRIHTPGRQVGRPWQDWTSPFLKVNGAVEIWVWVP